mmetsp:Transcript_75360/g.224682  ORF Transcript_75360/g.224682 Transcript_75360/m.224682 type:complete len:221 (-) Transcript_75360:36-698(-)
MPMPWFACCYSVEPARQEEAAGTFSGATEAAEIKVDPKDAALPVVTTWTADLHKALNRKLGMEISPLENVLRVDSIHEDGVVVDFNSSYPKQAIQPGDYITSVNGVKGGAFKMLSEARDMDDLSVTICRTRTFRAEVNKTGALGATFGVYNKVLVVQDIKAGPLLEWNAANIEQEIQPGDQILEVNGAKGISLDIADALKENGQLSILVLPLAGAGSAGP